MAAAWGRAWRSRIPSTAHGDNSGEDDGGRSLQPIGGVSVTPNSGSTASGTTSSGTTTTTTASPFRQQSFDLHRFNIPEDERMMIDYMKSLVVEFGRNEHSPLKRWLWELRVNWVLHLPCVSETGQSFFTDFPGTWILALLEITKYISVYCGGWCSKEDWPPASEFIRFVEATLSEMLPFVAARVCPVNQWWGPWAAAQPAVDKLQALIDVHDAVSNTSSQILSSFRYSACVDYHCYTDETTVLSSPELLAKLDEATWNTMEEVKTRVMSFSCGATTSSGIHPITRPFMSYIKLLWDKYGSVNRILHDAFLRAQFMVPHQNIEKACHLTNLAIEMSHSLVEKLTQTSKSFVDPGCYFLFLINNCHFILQQLHTNCTLCFNTLDLAGKIGDYINSYIQVSWAPVMKCLHNPTPRCFTKYSPLPKFLSKFQKAYTAQKFWRVPDPEMRKIIREATIEEVIPGFTEFLKDNTNSSPRISPQEMKVVLAAAVAAQPTMILQIFYG